MGSLLSSSSSAAPVKHVAETSLKPSKKRTVISAEHTVEQVKKLRRTGLREDGYLDANGVIRCPTYMETLEKNYMRMAQYVHFGVVYSILTPKEQTVDVLIQEHQGKVKDCTKIVELIQAFKGDKDKLYHDMFTRYMTQVWCLQKNLDMDLTTELLPLGFYSICHEALFLDHRSRNNFYGNLRVLYPTHSQEWAKRQISGINGLTNTCIIYLKEIPTSIVLTKQFISDLHFSLTGISGTFAARDYAIYNEADPVPTPRLAEAHLEDLISFINKEVLNTKTWKDRLVLAAFFYERFFNMQYFKENNEMVAEVIFSYFMLEFTLFPVSLYLRKRDLTFKESREVYTKTMDIFKGNKYDMPMELVAYTIDCLYNSLLYIETELIM